MASIRFGISLPPQTEAETEKYVSQVLDPQIEELSRQLMLLQGLRRALAEAFGIDRREDAGTFAKMADMAKRAELEGDDTIGANGKMVPPGPLRGIPADTPTIVMRHEGFPS